MWKMLSEWLFAFLNMARELEESRRSIRRVEERIRDAEEAIKLLAQELRHARELDIVEREKMLLRLQQELLKIKEIAAPGGKKNR
jgi:archaellum component FlaC